MASVELCPKCHASILTSYQLSFQKDFAGGYQNPTQSEVVCIKNTLGNRHAELEGLIQEIERVESMLDVLKAHPRISTRTSNKAANIYVPLPSVDYQSKFSGLSSHLRARRSSAANIRHRSPSASSAPNGVTWRSLRPRYGHTSTLRHIRVASICTSTSLNDAETSRFPSRSKFLTTSGPASGIAMIMIFHTRRHTRFSHLPELHSMEARGAVYESRGCQSLDHNYPGAPCLRVSHIGE
ncbi:hypothetical protein CPB85DRAFT_934781 [Mucidula mucida]|nr:hypothetical protein CPB85DRAFT_934781 [Mucidula mucida]